MTKEILSAQPIITPDLPIRAENDALGPSTKVLESNPVSVLDDPILEALYEPSESLTLPLRQRSEASRPVDTLVHRPRGRQRISGRVVIDLATNIKSEKRSHRSSGRSSRERCFRCGQKHPALLTGFSFNSLSPGNSCQAGRQSKPFFIKNGV